MTRLLRLVVLAGGLAVACLSGRAAQAQAVTIQPTGLMEASVSACAGGAAIGYLIVAASGAPGAGQTALLFCGLSVAATVSGTVATMAWRTVTGVLP